MTQPEGYPRMYNYSSNSAIKNLNMELPNTKSY